MSKIPIRLILGYYWDAQTIYSAHSPFVFHFVNYIMNNQKRSDRIQKIEKKRSEFLRSSESISFLEFGAGTSIGKNSNERKVSDVAKNSLSGKWQCRILYNLIKEYELENILEIGTSLGISTAYLACGNPNADIITLEGNPSSASIATKLFKDLNLKHIDIRIGEFGDTLNASIADFNNIGMAFIDGNHRKEATIEYFDKIKAKTTSKSIVVVDDIYWSKGMNEAWNEIIQDDSVAFSIDLFRMGILFFDESIMVKQHFKLIPYKYKPWAIGLFG